MNIFLSYGNKNAIWEVKNLMQNSDGDVTAQIFDSLHSYLFVACLLCPPSKPSYFPPIIIQGTPTLGSLINLDSAYPPP
jgi:hypothetical protein